MSDRYVRAEEILPEDLIQEIRKYFSGGCLYIAPRKRAARIRRNLDIIVMRRAGVSVAEIAERMAITPRAVRYILQKASAGRASSPRK